MESVSGSLNGAPKGADDVKSFELCVLAAISETRFARTNGHDREGHDPIGTCMDVHRGGCHMIYFRPVDRIVRTGLRGLDNFCK